MFICFHRAAYTVELYPPVDLGETSDAQLGRSAPSPSTAPALSRSLSTMQWLRVLLACVLVSSINAFVVTARAAAPPRSSVSMMAAAAFRTGDMVEVISGDSKVGAARGTRATPAPAPAREPRSWCRIRLPPGSHPAPRCPRPACAPSLASVALSCRLLAWQGTVAKVIKMDKKKGMVTVEGVNIRTKHQKPMKEGESGELVKKEQPIHVSNVAASDETADEGGD